MTEHEAPTPERRSKNRYKAEQISEADRMIAKAFVLLGLTTENTLVCPICSTSKRGKVKIKQSAQTGRPYWRCHRCTDPGEGSELRPWGGSAIDLLKLYGGRDFPTAVGELLSDVNEGASAEKISSVTIAPSFRATVDVEIYDNIRDAGSYDKAAEYYGRWHISPESVRAVGATLIEDPEGLAEQLTSEYGLHRLSEAGVVTEGKDGSTVFLFSEDYCVVEPHTAPSGHVVGMQFRPSPRRLEAVAAHKQWKKRWSGVQDQNGETVEPAEAWRRAYSKDRTVGRRSPYVTPFLSLRGGGPDHLVGGGLHLLYPLPSGSDVYVVEGIKDLMAAHTMGVAAYAIPGVSAIPPERAIAILRKHRLHVMLDGDKAGEQGRENLVNELRSAGVDASPADHLKDGMDVTDTLVEREAHVGCPCGTCEAWRAERPWDAATCACRTCRTARTTTG